MPLKRKFTIVIMCCLAVNLLLTTVSFKIFLLRHCTNFEFLEQYLLSTVESQNIAISADDMHTLISAAIDINQIADKAFMVGIHNVIKASLYLLIILLIGVLYYIHREICKPIEKLSNAIKEINDKNGYFTKDTNKNEIKNLSSNFFLMAEQIEVNKRKKDELISYITHDIRTPLTSISGYTQRLIDPGIADEAKRTRYHQTILSKATDIKVLIEELDSYIADDIQDISLTEVNIYSLLNSLLNEYEDELSAYEITLKRHINLSPASYWKLDIKRINRVFSNIFSNAVSHGTPPMQILFSAFEKDQQLYIKIENNGEGLDDDQYSKVFELMYQGDFSRSSTPHQGRGLGLTIVRQIITRHGGTVNAYKPSTGGFGISISLPHLP